MAGEPFCRSCGRILQAGVLKCPDCGAPQGAAVPPTRRFSKASTAGFLLIVCFTLAMFQGVFVLMQPEPPPGPSFFSLGTFSMEGTVRGEDGSPIPGANVSVPAQNRSTVTDENGTYELESLQPGIIDVLFERPGFANVTVRVGLISGQTVDAILPAEGSSEPIVKHGSYRVLSIGLQVCGFLIVAGGLLTLLGGIAAYRRRNWGLALAGSIVGLFVWPPLTLLLAGVAIFMVANSRKEFQKL